MERKKTRSEGCAREIFVPERSIEEERSSKRCSARNEESKEDTQCSESRIK
jgi:hypothetical protein